jgi:hypothetical protein
MEVWHEWTFSPEGIVPRRRKWVTSTTTQCHRPTQTTPCANLLLAGAHTRTAADIWSIEGAVESGRRAARCIDRRVTVLPQYRPLVQRVLALIDDAFYRRGWPHVLSVTPLFVAAGGAFLIAWRLAIRGASASCGSLTG